MKKIIINFSIWFGVTLAMLYIWANLLLSAGLYYSIFPHIKENMIVFAFPLVGSIVQSIFIRAKYFQLGVISILFIGLITSIVSSVPLALLDSNMFRDGLDIKQFQDFVVWVVKIFSIPCCVISGISYAATANHKYQQE